LKNGEKVIIIEWKKNYRHLTDNFFQPSMFVDGYRVFEISYAKIAIGSIYFDSAYVSRDPATDIMIIIPDLPRGNRNFIPKVLSI
jgi:hypothetical protein